MTDAELLKLLRQRAAELKIDPTQSEEEPTEAPPGSMADIIRAVHNFKSAEAPKKRVPSFDKIKAMLNSNMGAPAAPVGERPAVRNPASVSDDIQLKPDEVRDIPVEKFNIDGHTDEDATVIDGEAMRKEALQRIEDAKKNKKLKFSGGFLDQNGIYDND